MTTILPIFEPDFFPLCRRCLKIQNSSNIIANIKLKIRHRKHAVAQNKVNAIKRNTHKLNDLF